MKKELLEKIEKGRALLAKVYEQAGADYDFKKVTEISGSDEEKVSKVREMNSDLAKASKQLDDIQAVERAREIDAKAQAAEVKSNRPPAPEAKGEGKSRFSQWSDLFKAGGNFDPANRHKDVKNEVSAVELKTLFERTAGWAAESLRSGRLVDYAVRPIQVLDLMPQIPTSMAAYKYMDETTRDESLAVEKAEGAAAGELQLALTERSVTIEKLPAALPVTDEQLEDVDGISAYVDSRLSESLRRRADYQCLLGTGVTPLMLGVTQKSGIQTTAAGIDDGIADHVARAIKDIRITGRAIASAVILHPTDWLTERLRKTKDGAYIWGNPSETGLTVMWGLPVAQSDSLTAGKAVIGDFRMHSLFVVRKEITTKVGYYNDDIVKGRQMVVATLRAAFVWDRAAAFNYITLPSV